MTPRPSIECIPRTELAKRLGYDDPKSAALDRFLKRAGIASIPHRRGWYYVRAVEAALDRMHGLNEPEPTTDDAFGRWRARRAS